MINWDEIREQQDRNRLIHEYVFDKAVIDHQHDWVYVVDELGDGYGGFEGWQCERCNSPAMYHSRKGPEFKYNYVPNYMNNVLLILEKMRQDGYEWTSWTNSGSPYYTSRFHKADRMHRASRNSIEDAIALSALRAKGLWI